MLRVLGRRAFAVTEVPAPAGDRAVRVRARIREVDRQVRCDPRVVRRRCGRTANPADRTERHVVYVDRRGRILLPTDIPQAEPVEFPVNCGTRERPAGSRVAVDPVLPLVVRGAPVHLGPVSRVERDDHVVNVRCTVMKYLCRQVRFAARPREQELVHLLAARPADADKMRHITICERIRSNDELDPHIRFRVAGTSVIMFDVRVLASRKHDLQGLRAPV